LSILVEKSVMVWIVWMIALVTLLCLVGVFLIVDVVMFMFIISNWVAIVLMFAGTLSYEMEFLFVLDLWLHFLDTDIIIINSAITAKSLQFSPLAMMILCASATMDPNLARAGMVLTFENFFTVKDVIVVVVVSRFCGRQVLLGPSTPARPSSRPPS